MRTIDKVRLILNTLFLIATVATVIMWIADSRSFFYIGVAALTFKILEFILRFVN